MTPQESTNFLIEVTPEVYSEINRLLEEQDYNSIVLHYSPYWKEMATHLLPNLGLRRKRDE